MNYCKLTLTIPVQLAWVSYLAGWNAREQISDRDRDDLLAELERQS